MEVHPEENCNKPMTKAWMRSYSVRKDLDFLMLCSANLHDCAVFALWSLRVRWSSKITTRFLTQLII